VKKTASIGFVLALAATSAVAQVRDTPQTPVIVTTGEGVVKHAPDRAWVVIGAESRARTAAEAQKANSDAMAAVIDKIKSGGIPPDAIVTSGYNLQPEFDYQNGKQSLRGYVARNQVQVRVDSLAKTGDVIAAAVVTGATNVGSVRFDYKDRDGAEREALRLAVRAARMRADAMAGGAGVTIDHVVAIEEQREPPSMRPMAMGGMAMLADRAAAQPPVPIEAGEIEIRARVTLTAAIR